MAYAPYAPGTTPDVPGSIPPSAPSTPHEHSEPDVDRIIKLIMEDGNFLKKYITEWVPELVHDGLDNFVQAFHNSIPELSKNVKTVIDSIKKEYRLNSRKLMEWLKNAELTGSALKLTDELNRACINDFMKSAKHGIGWIRRKARKVFDIINSFLGSLKEALSSVTGAGAVIEAIKQLKDHLKIATT